MVRRQLVIRNLCVCLRKFFLVLRSVLGTVFYVLRRVLLWSYFRRRFSYLLLEFYRPLCYPPLGGGRFVREDCGTLGGFV